MSTITFFQTAVLSFPYLWLPATLLLPCRLSRDLPCTIPDRQIVMSKERQAGEETLLMVDGLAGRCAIPSLLESASQLQGLTLP